MRPWSRLESKITLDPVPAERHQFAKRCVFRTISHRLFTAFLIYNLLALSGQVNWGDGDAMATLSGDGGGSYDDYLEMNWFDSISSDDNGVQRSAQRRASHLPLKYVFITLGGKMKPPGDPPRLVGHQLTMMCGNWVAQPGHLWTAFTQVNGLPPGR